MDNRKITEDEDRHNRYWEAWYHFLYVWAIVGLFSIVFSWVFWQGVNLIHESFLLISHHLRGW